MSSRYLIPGLKFGLTGGLIQFLSFLLFYYLGFRPLLNLNTLILDIILIFIFVFFGTKDFKTRFNSGELRFWQGMSVGFVAYMTLSLLSAILLYSYLEFIEPKVIAEYIEQTRVYLENSEIRTEELITPEEFKKNLDELEKTSAKILAISAFWKKVFIGLLVTPVSSIILRK
jgi:hypothetical protein